jgi:hypothetical protein
MDTSAVLDQPRSRSEPLTLCAFNRRLQQLPLGPRGSFIFSNAPYSLPLSFRKKAIYVLPTVLAKPGRLKLGPCNRNPSKSPKKRRRLKSSSSNE